MIGHLQSDYQSKRPDSGSVCQHVHRGIPILKEVYQKTFIVFPLMDISTTREDHVCFFHSSRSIRVSRTIDTSVYWNFSWSELSHNRRISRNWRETLLISWSVEGYMKGICEWPQIERSRLIFSHEFTIKQTRKTHNFEGDKDSRCLDTSLTHQLK
jgi:hypothetical protein